MKKIKVMSVFGTRPEAIKMAPLVKELAKYTDLESICCLTGQHREMLDSVIMDYQYEGNDEIDFLNENVLLELQKMSGDDE